MTSEKTDKRRQYSAAMKAQVVAEYGEPGASVDAIWLACEPLDIGAGTETALGRVVRVFGEARLHHAYLFANRRGNRMKALVYDGIGVWLAARRLNAGRFIWPKDGSTLALTRPQLDALVLGLPWQRIGDAGVITVV